jgi:hypothetical protein
VCFGLLWTDVAYAIRVGDSVILGDLGLLGKKYCAGAFDLFGGGSRSAEAMGEESTPFICKGAFPDGCVGTEEELGKGALFAGRWWSSGERGDVVGVSFVGGALG